MPQYQDSTALRSEQVQELLTAVPNWMIRWGNTLFLSLIIMLLFLSWFIKYPDIVPATATLTTQIPPQKEYAKITSTIDTILVEDHQLVKSKQALAVLENTASYADILTLKSKMDAVQSNGTSFYFPIDSLPVLLLGEVESSFALFQNSYIQYRLNKKLQPFSNEAIANEQSRSELETRLKNLKFQKEVSQSELFLKEKNLERHKELFAEGIISARDYEGLQLEYLLAKRDSVNRNFSISQLRESIGNAQKISRSNSINREKEEMVLLKNVIQSFSQLKNSLKEWNTKYVLKSEVNGHVSFFNSLSPNQRVKQGDLVFTIIPTEYSAYLAKLKTPALNSGKIKIGQQVNIKMTNYPDAEFGILSGEVRKIALFPDAEGFYSLEASLPEKLITSYNREIQFKQEMSGTAEIIMEDLRLIERFFYQLKGLFKR